MIWQRSTDELFSYMQSLRNIYHKAPLSPLVRRKVKKFIFTNFPSIFRRTDLYLQWLATEAEPSSQANKKSFHWNRSDGFARPYISQVLRQPFSGDAGATNDYRAQCAGAGSVAIQAVAFYLPQFHPIPENDRWWGRGFTEWVNVTKAVPQFVGHYQPHLPGELGFYDLRLQDVIRQQIELALYAGLHAFCFYYYWFDGKRLLNKPLDSFVETEETFPFCLCWANENWTRRWDGLDKEILIAQRYGPKGDVGPMADMLNYFRRPNYFRVNGRPFVLIYRITDLPDAQDMIAAWRHVCRNVGIGEIFVASVRHDDDVDPSYGLDAVIDFPPHRLAKSLPSINKKLEIVNPDYKGYVVDYDDVVRAARQPDRGRISVPWVRGVMPGWDNEARRPARGFTVHNSTPFKYRTWLREMARFARQNPVSGQSIVFINAWNEWAEGAHLEPDRRYGYAYLTATRQAITFPQGVSATAGIDRVCVIVHVYYPDLLGEILDILRSWSVSWRLLITTQRSQVASVKEILASHDIVGEIFVYENRGRDILPFIEAMRRGAFEHELILKLHTKRSLHRADGDRWRRELLSSLAAPEVVDRVVRAFQAAPDLGLVGPVGHWLPLSSYWGANENNVTRLCERLGLALTAVGSELFAAGSMFFVRPQALQRLISSTIDVSDFEEEEGQVDGTLAHAIERCISIIVWNDGFAVASSEDPESLLLGESSSYSYAQKSSEEGRQ